MDEIDKMLKKLEQVNEDQHQRMEKLEQEKLSLQRYIDELLLANMNMAGEIERLKTTEKELKTALVKECWENFLLKKIQKKGMLNN